MRKVKIASAREFRALLTPRKLANFFDQHPDEVLNVAAGCRDSCPIAAFLKARTGESWYVGHRYSRRWTLPQFAIAFISLVDSIPYTRVSGQWNNVTGRKARQVLRDALLGGVR